MSIETGISPAVIKKEIPHTEIVPMLNMVVAMKAQDKLLDMTVARGKPSDVNTLQRELKKQATMSEKSGKEPAATWDDNISQIASAMGDKETARRARLVSKAKKLVAAAKEE